VDTKEPENFTKRPAMKSYNFYSVITTTLAPEVKRALRAAAWKRHLTLAAHVRSILVASVPITDSTEIDQALREMKEHENNA